jgi:hypothetical protein
MRKHSFKTTCISLVLSLVSFVTYASGDQFCAGFERGYITGYKQATGSSLDPLTPLCPLQPMKRLSDPDSDYEHGYLIGLQRGLAARR